MEQWLRARGAMGIHCQWEQLTVEAMGKESRARTRGNRSRVTDLCIGSLAGIYPVVVDINRLREEVDCGLELTLAIVTLLLDQCYLEVTLAGNTLIHQ